MSDFTVLRSLDGYCLVLDNKRIAGGKPDYRGENVLVDWTTEVAYGPVDDLAAENAKLRELVRDMNKWLWNGADCTECPFAAKCDLNAAFESDLHANVCLGWSEIHRRMRELGVDA